MNWYDFLINNIPALFVGVLLGVALLASVKNVRMVNHIEPSEPWPHAPGEKNTIPEHGELPQPQPEPEMTQAEAQLEFPWMTADIYAKYTELRLPFQDLRHAISVHKAIRLGEDCASAILGEKPYVDVWCYWRIARDGTPTVSICDDPMSHPHAHLVRIPVPDDVQKCIVATKNPPRCLIVDKKGYATGECPKEAP